MEFIVLGLLMLKPMTGYEIVCFLKSNFRMICSDSSGSVQIALKKLIHNEKIAFSESIENGKNKKTYSITDKGKAEFANWVKCPMQSGKIKNKELSKLFFLGFANKEHQVSAIEDYIKQLKKVEQEVLTIAKMFEENIEIAKKLTDIKNNEDVIKFQVYILDYGVQSISFEINWYTQLLEKVRGDKK